MNSLKFYEEKLEKEQRKLNILISRALKGPIVTHQEIIDQSQKVDKLIELI